MLKTKVIELKEELYAKIDSFVAKISVSHLELLGVIVLLIVFAIIFGNSMIDKAKEFSTWIKNLDDIATLDFAFWFSLVLLTAISFIKYFINHDSERKDWGEALMEFPIDVCNILITVIVSLYLSKHIGSGALLLGFSLVVSLLCAYLRRLSIKKGGFEHMTATSVISGLADIGVAYLWIYFVLHTIS